MQYLFPQQARDPVCHCLFIFNLTLLKQIKAKQQDYVWRTQEEWIGITFPGIVAWQIAMERLTNPKAGENNKFSEYQKYMLEHGIHLEKIYTESGRMYYKSSLDPLKNLQKVWLSPYHFVSTSLHPDVLEKTLPLYSDGRDHFIFDLKRQSYKKLELLTKNNYLNKINTNLICLSGQSVPLSLEEQKYLELPEYSYLNSYKINNKNIKFKYGYKYQYLPKQANNSVYFHVGLFQLLNLAMGVDQENNLINKDHNLYPVYQNLRKEMTKHPENPWGMPEFNANNNLEYHLAELFKQNPRLMQEVIKVNKYPFNTYEHYENLDNLYNSKDKKHRKLLANSKTLLPGKAQMLAYSFSQSLLTIWTAAVSERALYAVLELPKFLRPILYFASKNYHNKILKTVYESKQNDTRSFIAIWQEIKQMIQQKGIEELFSFDGHGVVVSFDKDLINLQNNNMKIGSPKLMQDLGFTIIDSLYAESVKPFYIKKQTKLAC